MDNKNEKDFDPIEDLSVSGSRDIPAENADDDEPEWYDEPDQLEEQIRYEASEISEDAVWFDDPVKPEESEQHEDPEPHEEHAVPAVEKPAEKKNMFERRGGSNVPPGPQRFLSYLLFPLVLIYYEILARAFTKTPIFPNLIYPVLFAAALGFLLSAVMSLLGPRLRWHFTNVLIAVIAFYYGLEAVLRNTYQVYMNFSTIFGELGNVTGNYGGDVASGFIGAIPLIIVYYIPFILRFVFWKRYRPARGFSSTITLSSLGCWIGLWGLGILLALNIPSVSPKFAAQFEFDTAIRTFGIAEGTGLDLQYSLSGNPAAESFTIVSSAVEAEEEAEEGVDEEVLYEDGEGDAVTIEEAAEEAVDYGYNVMNIDFDELIAETDDDAIKSIHEYVNSLEPSAKNEYTGLFEGKNLITICAESFAMQAINEDLTPTLYRLANNGIKFTNFYQPAWGGSTSTGEYSLLIGLVPVDHTDSMLNTIGENMYFTTGNQFQRLGYTSLAFHNGTYTYYDRDKTHTNLGYDDFICFDHGLDDLVPRWSEDEPTFRATMEAYLLDNQPFNAYYMSYSGHCDYVAGDPKVAEYYDELKAYYGDTYKDTTLYYLCYQMEFEHALTTMVDMLEEAGIADDTVIVICPDHYPYGLAESTTFNNTEDYLKDLYKVDSYDGFVRDNTSLIIWSGCIEDMGLEVDTPVYSLDILPTISNLFGLEYDSRLLVGRDVFADEEPLCIWSDYSFLTEKGWYNAATDVFLPTTDEEVTDEYLDRIKTIVANKVAFSIAVTNYDYYGILFGEDDVK